MPQLLPWPWLELEYIVRLLIFALVFLGLVPVLIFPNAGSGSGADRAMRRLLWMVFGLTALDHLLAMMHLFEAVLVIVVLLAATGWVWFFRRPGEQRDRVWNGSLAWLLDVLEGRVSIRTAWSRLEDGWQWPTWTLEGAGTAAVTILVVFVAAWMRMARGFSTAAPAFSDAPVTLVWIKQFGLGHVYASGIYPKGMYAITALAHKFTAMNVVGIVDGSAGLVTLCIVLTLMFAVRRFTGSLGAAAIAGLVYGTLPAWLSNDFARQAALDSQEYGLIFVMLASWFAYRAVFSEERADYLAAAAAAGICGFTHPLAAIGAVVFMGAALVAGVLRRPQGWSAALRVVTRTAGAGLLAVAPMAVAYLMGTPIYSSALKYIQSTGGETPHLLTAPDVLAGLTGLAGLFIGFLLEWWQTWDRRMPAGTAEQQLAAASDGPAVGGGTVSNQLVPRGLRALTPLWLIGGASAIIYLLPDLGIQSTFLAGRGGGLTSLGTAGVAAGVWFSWELLSQRLHLVQPAILALVVAALWLHYPPTPTDPYAIYTSSEVYQYLRASASLETGNWTLVSGASGYALAMGDSYHMLAQDFVKMADTLPPDLLEWYRDAPGHNYGVTRYYVLVVEKQSPRIDPQAKQDALDGAAQLQQWINTHRDYPLKEVANNDELSVWLLTLPPRPAGT